MHRLSRERPPVEPAGAQPDHFLLAVDDLEGEVRTHPDDDHVERIGAYINGGKAHRLPPVARFHYNQGFVPFLYTMPSSIARHQLLRPRLERFTRALQGVEDA